MINNEDKIGYFDYLTKKLITRCHLPKKEAANIIEYSSLDKLLNEYEAENKMLRDQLRFAVATLSSEKELEAYNAFVAKHNQSCRNTKATGGMMPYIKQIGHGLGCCTTVYCQVCGASKDITDSSVW